MTALILLQLLATFSCVLAIRWLLATRTRLAAEASAGKDELLAAKDRVLDAQARELAALRELTPLRIREFLAASRAELGGCCAALDAGHRAARKEIERCNAEITRLQDQGDWHAEAIGPLAARRDERSPLESKVVICQKHLLQSLPSFKNYVCRKTALRTASVIGFFQKLLLP